MDEEGHHVAFELLRRCDDGAFSSAVGRAAIRRLLGGAAASACTAGGPLLLLLLLLAGIPRLHIPRRCADHPLRSLLGAGRGHSHGTLWNHRCLPLFVCRPGNLVLTWSTKRFVCM